MPEPLPPLLKVVFDALIERGWTMEHTVGQSPLAPLYRDPEGNAYARLEDAIIAQSMREIAQVNPPEFDPDDPAADAWGSA